MKNSQISIFNFQDSEVRIISINGEPWFLAKDLCDVLAINNSRDAVAKLDDDEKSSVVLTDGTAGNPNMSIVSESGMYSLVLRSRKKQAKVFKKWVTAEVLPSIRKTGKYSVDQQKTMQTDEPSTLSEAFLTLGVILEREMTAIKDENSALKQRIAVIKQENVFLKRQIVAIEQEYISFKQRIIEQEEMVGTTAILAEGNACELSRFKDGHGQWYSVVGYIKKHKLKSLPRSQTSAIGRKASALCKKMGIELEQSPDSRYGHVNVYPEYILDEVFVGLR